MGRDGICICYNIGYGKEWKADVDTVNEIWEGMQSVYVIIWDMGRDGRYVDIRYGMERWGGYRILDM